MAGTLPESKVHELMYFLQVAGEPLQLDYSEGNGGLYAGDLRRVLRKMEGRWISGRHNARDESDTPFKLIPGAIEDAKGFLADLPDTRRRVSRVGALMEGFETPLGVKLLASVHWAVHNERSTSVGDVTRRLRGREFYRKQIEQAYQTLERLGWLHDEERSRRTIYEEPVSSTETYVSEDMVSEQGDDYPPSDGSPGCIDINTATVDDLEASEIPSCFT